MAVEVAVEVAAERRGKGDERYYTASQYQLVWRKFRRHKLALVGGPILIALYVVGVGFPEFFATQDLTKRHQDFVYAPPQRIHFFDADGVFHLRPFVYAQTRSRDPETMRRIYTEDTSSRFPLYLFVRGDPYELWGLFPSDLHFIGVKEGYLFLFGTERLGRDLFSRTLHAARISLSIGLIGVGLSFILGCVLGGISGFYGGAIDTVIQRVIEFLVSIPTLPLWMALAAAVPAEWPQVRVYFAITIILSVVGWAGLARVVRGKVLSLREEDFVQAAAIAGSKDGSIIVRHILPSFFSYLIVHVTLAVPRMFLGETALSFLGLGLQVPVVSWGVLLSEGQNVQTIAIHPWIIIPAIFVIVSVLAFNFVGDGLRDAADPYKL